MKFHRLAVGLKRRFAIRRNLMMPYMLSLALCSACTYSSVSPEGKWTRPVAESDLDIQGNETLIFNHDSTFTITNDLMLDHTDSVFQCKMAFKTFVAGVWQTEGNRIILHPDKETFTLDTIPGGVNITLLKGEFSDSVKFSMTSDLVGGLNGYYYEVYSDMSDRDGFVLENPVIDKNILAATVDSALSVRWNLLEPSAK